MVSKIRVLEIKQRKGNRYAHFVYSHHFGLLPLRHSLLQLNILPLVFVPPTEEGISPLGNRIIYLPQRRASSRSERRTAGIAEIARKRERGIDGRGRRRRLIASRRDGISLRLER